jgi:ribonuclease BN (tRNA processing enzyme)
VDCLDRCRLTAAALAFVGALTVYPAQGAPASAGSAPLEVIVLGSGGPAALGRASASYLVLLDGAARIMVDAGPGSFARLGEAHVSFAALDTVLLTHLHVDHAGELPGIVKARAVSSAEPIAFQIFGPGGHPAGAAGAAFPATSRFVELLFGAQGAFAYLKDFSAPVTFNVTDISPAARDSQPILVRGGLTISAIAGHHDDAPAVIYRIDYRGYSVVFSGDVDAQGLPALERMARQSTLLIFDAVVLDPPDSPAVLYSLHSPPRAIGALAARAHVGQLLLSHLSPAVENDRAGVLASIAAHYHGPVTFAADLMHVRP